MLDGKPDDVNLKMLNERMMDKLKSSYDKEKRWVGRVLAWLEGTTESSIHAF